MLCTRNYNIAFKTIINGLALPYNAKNSKHTKQEG